MKKSASKTANRDLKKIQDKLPRTTNMGLVALNEIREEEQLSFVSKIKERKYKCHVYLLKTILISVGFEN